MNNQSKKQIIRNIKKSGNTLSIGKRLGINILLLIAFIFFIGPVLWILLLSFKNQSQITSWPPDVFSGFTLDNYHTIFSRIRNMGSLVSGDIVMSKKVEKLVTSLGNTALLSISSVAISLIVGVPAAYGLSRFKNKTKEKLAMMFMSFRFVPELLTIVPLYLIYQKVGLYGTTFGLIWVYILISLPLIIWISRIGFDDLPYELEQAAILDKYSRTKAFFKVILPLAKPSIAAATVLSFIYAWNNFLMGFVLSSGNSQPVTVAIMGFYDITGLNYGLISAAVILAILPPIIVSQIASKYLVSGLSMGAVKR